MRYLAWLVYCAVFLALFAFTLKNTTPVTLHGLLDAHWDAPLVVFLFVFFVAGCVLGPTWSSQLCRSMRSSEHLALGEGRGWPPRRLVAAVY